MIDPVKFEIDITSDRIPNRTVQLDPAVSDVDIYENIDFPFLTAKILITDEMNFLERFDIIGGERVQIKLTNMKSKKDGGPQVKPIIKKFYVSQILTANRGEDNRTQTIALHLIEDIGFESNLQNLNVVYKGKCSDIITKIVSNYLGKELDTEAKDIQTLKAIVPNLSPLDACTWFSNRATTTDGYPFFFYSTLVDKNLQFNDLGTLLERAVLNPTDDKGDSPTFKYSKSASMSEDHIIAYNTIYDYKLRNTENLYSLVSQGLIGSKQQFVNSSAVAETANTNFNFNVSEDLLTIFKFNLLPKKQNNLLFSDLFKFNGKSFNELKSRTITQFGGSNSHRTTKSSDYDRSYSEDISKAHYKNTTKSQALLEYMFKAPLTFSVTGNEFARGLHNNTIGRRIRLQFLPTDTFAQPDNLNDSKLSGEYLITGARHVLKRERYDITFSGARFANMEIPEVNTRQAPVYDFDKGGPG